MKACVLWLLCYVQNVAAQQQLPSTAKATLRPQHLAHDARDLCDANKPIGATSAREIEQSSCKAGKPSRCAHNCIGSRRTCQYFELHRSTQLFSPTFRSVSLYLRTRFGS